jgi:hypothetical protein
MNHYIDTNNNIWGFDNTQTSLIPTGAVLIPITYTPDQYPFLTLVNGVINFDSKAYTDTVQADKLAACKLQAKTLLLDTDWSTLSDITTSTPKLINQTDFLTYRNAVRALAVNPVATPVWPERPTAQWG